MPSCISTCKLNKQISKPVQNRLCITQSITFWFQKWWCIIFLLLLTSTQVISHPLPLLPLCLALPGLVPLFESWQAKEDWWQSTNAWVWESAEQLLYMEWHCPTKEIPMSSKHLSQRTRHEHPAICLQNPELLWIGNDKLMSTVAVWSPSCIVWTWYLHPGGKTALNKM